VQAAAAQGGSAPSEPELRLARRLSWLQLGFTVSAAICAYAYFHPDEHFQTLEWAGLKVGHTLPSELAWEYRAEIRPWLLPAVYTALFAAARAAGIEDTFAWAALARLATGLFSWWAARRLLFATLPSVHPATRRTHLFVCTLLPFLPYLFTRTSGETAAAACLALACVPLLGPSALGPRAALAAGIWLGLGVVVRPQLAFAALGVTLHQAIVERRGRGFWLGAVAGASLATGLGLLADRWGYGHWVVTPWSYLHVNLFEGKAAAYGTAPFFAYPALVAANVFFPIAALALLAVAVSCVRSPRHLFTWAAVPFLLVHSVLAHKEERFLFPLLTLATVRLWPALAATGEGNPAGQRLARLLRPLVGPAGLRLLAAWGLLAGALCTFYPFNWRSTAMAHRWLYRHAASGGQVRAANSLDYLPLFARGPFRPLDQCDRVPGTVLYVVRERFDGAPPPVPAGSTLRFTDSVLADSGPGRAFARRLLALCDRAHDGLFDGIPDLPWHSIYEGPARPCP
jgi:phosphatidylinositol glycan class B